jgi:osmotically-inducible protein OsmY
LVAALATDAAFRHAQHGKNPHDNAGVGFALLHDMQFGRFSSATLISSFLALAAGALAIDVQTAALTEPQIHRATNEADVFITRTLRDKITADAELSFTARSIKLYTTNGVVKLRGCVIYPNEHERILGFVRAMDGVTEVDDQLSILIP